MYCTQQALTDTALQDVNDSPQEILNDIGLMEKERTINSIYIQDKQNFITESQQSENKAFTIFSSTPLVRYQLAPDAEYLPKICPDSNNLQIPHQETIHFQPHELKKINLYIRFILPKNYCAL